MSCGNVCVVVLLGPGPVFLLFRRCLRGETQIWLGDLRVVLCFWFLVFFLFCLFGHCHEFWLYSWNHCNPFASLVFCLYEVIGQTREKIQRQTFSKQNFVQKLWTQVSIPWVTQKDGCGVWLVVSYVLLPFPCDDQKMEPKRLLPHKISIYLRAPLNPGKVRVSCALVPSLVVEAWILIGDVWNLVGEVQSLVALQTAW